MNRKCRIELKSNRVVIHGNAPSFVYEIETDLLTKGITEDKIKLSHWITILLDKNWIEKEVLYELAVIIQNSDDKNSIDWKSTFYNVELKEALKTETIQKRNSEIKMGFEEEDKIFLRKNFMKMNANPELINNIMHSVELNLFKHNLIP